MSNIGRPRTGMKPCPYCGDKNRDSNGQCRCRNAAYRAFRGVAKTTADKARKVYNDALKNNKGDVAKALTTTREEFPSLVKVRQPADRKAPTKKATKPKKGKDADKAADAIVEKAKEKAKAPRYVLVIKDGFTDPYEYARKDAAVKNGVKSGEEWEVTLNGKVVAQSDDLL
jgi:hypothetical protein